MAETPAALPNPAPDARAASPRGAARDRAAWMLLSAALGIGLLRFWRLGEWSLWIDEAYTYADAWFGARGDGVWNPLGYALVRWTAERFGGRPDEFALRFAPAVAGWLCLPAAFCAFRSLVGDRRAALVALLLAVSPWHVYWSQNARFYTFAMLTSLVGSGVALRGLFAGRTPATLLGLAVMAAAAAFHVTAAVLVPAFALALPFAGRLGARPAPEMTRVSRLVLIAMGVGALAASPWLWTALQQHGEEKGTLDPLRGPAHLLLTSGFFYTPLVGAAAVIGALWAWRTRNLASLFAAGVALIGMGGLLLVSTRMLMTAQYTFCLLPWVLLVAVSPLEALGKCSAGRALFWAGGSALAATLFASTLLYFTTRRGERPRWREAFEFVDAEREPSDLVLSMGAPLAEFYLGATAPDPRRPRDIKALADWFPDGPRRWNRHDRRVWIVTRPQWLPSFRPQDVASIEAWLANDCRLVESYPVLMEGKDLEVRVYLFE